MQKGTVVPIILKLQEMHAVWCFYFLMLEKSKLKIITKPEAACIPRDLRLWNQKVMRTTPKQDKQRTYKVTNVALSCDHWCSGKAIGITHCECVCSFRYGPYGLLWRVRICINFSTLSHKRHDLKKNLDICVFCLSLQICVKHFSL